MTHFSNFLLTFVLIFRLLTHILGDRVYLLHFIHFDCFIGLLYIKHSPEVSDTAVSDDISNKVRRRPFLRLTFQQHP